MKPLLSRGIAGGALALVAVLIGLAVLAVGGILGWEFTNSNWFCTNACHAVHPEEPVAHAPRTPKKTIRTIGEKLVMFID